MSRWFRLYDELLDDPKVQMLCPQDFKGWVNLLCLASRNDGKLPVIGSIAFALRETEDAVSTLLERLLDGGLIERRSGGADGVHYAPYKWDERQYKSDTSTQRVKRFRERSKEVSETAPDTEAETEVSEAKASSTRLWACPIGVDPQHWRDFLRNRKTRHLTNSETAYQGQLRELQKLADNEWPPGRLVRHAAEKGWGSICDPRKPKYGTPASNEAGKSQAAYAMLNAHPDEPF